MLKEKRKKKGFTLAELLIVVAILAILVAVSIPIFTSQISKVRQATDEANMRSAKALAANCIMLEEFPEESWSRTISGGRIISYLAYYDAENGCLKKSEDIGDIKGYGQGSTYTDIYGGTASVKKGDIIAVTYSVYDINNPQLYIYWYEP